jgi:hypothetical protein
MQLIQFTLDSGNERSYTAPVTRARFGDLSVSIVSYAAQLIYAEKYDEAFHLLSASGRVLRYVTDDSYGAPVSLAEELHVVAAFNDVLGLIRGARIGLCVELDEQVLSETFIASGSLLDAFDLLSGEAHGDCSRLSLSESSSTDNRSFVLQGAGRSVHIPEGGRP